MVSNLFWVDGGRGGDLALCYSHRHNLEQENCDDADNFDHDADDKQNLEQEHCDDADNFDHDADDKHNLEQELCDDCGDERNLEHRQWGQLWKIQNEKVLSIMWHQGNDGINRAGYLHWPFCLVWTRNDIFDIIWNIFCLKLFNCNMCR